MTTASSTALLDRLSSVVAELQEVDLSTIAPADQLQFLRGLEALRRRVAHGTDRVTAQIDSSGAFAHDGHRNIRNTAKHLGRLTGGEALGRVQTFRAWPQLPQVEAAYAAGLVPIEHMRLIARVAANPRVHEHLEAADPLFAERACTDTYDELEAWMRDWLFLADPDGADRDDAIDHERRRVSLHRNFDGSWTLDGHFGALQGATFEEILSRFEQAEFEADWAEARDLVGDDACAADLRRTTQQRRADAAVAMAQAAASAPVDGRRPAPSVTIVVDQETFERELRRSCGEQVPSDPNVDIEGRICHTTTGTPLHPSDVLAAAMVGFVRRVVVDAAGTVIDLGRRRRLFTGSSREAAMLQAFLRAPGAGLGCFWPGCDGGARQIDHRHAAGAGGPTDIANSDVYCGSHNRLKETGFRPVRHGDGTWTIHRPDGGPITPAA